MASTPHPARTTTTLGLAHGQTPHAATVPAILSGKRHPARRGAPFDSLPFVSDCRIHLDRAWASHPPCHQPPRQWSHVEHCRPCRPIEPPCDATPPRDSIDRGLRPFWNYLERENLVVNVPTQQPAQQPTACEPATYRAQHAPRSCDSDTHAPDRSRDLGSDSRGNSLNNHRSDETNRQRRVAPSPIEIHIQRLIITGRIIDLVI